MSKGENMVERALRFLGWIDRKPGDMWPFPFAAFQPNEEGEGKLAITKFED